MHCKSIVVLSLCLCACHSAFAAHPFLIVTESMYPALRAKAANDPWKTLKQDAINTSNQGLTWIRA